MRNKTVAEIIDLIKAHSVNAATARRFAEEEAKRAIRVMGRMRAQDGIRQYELPVSLPVLVSMILDYLGLELVHATTTKLVKKPRPERKKA